MNPRLVASLRRLAEGRKIINDLAPDSFSHTCYREYCNPLCERDFIRMGVFARDTPLLMDNVWLCRFSSVHICSLSECNSASEGVCPISGLTFNHEVNVVGGKDYDADDYRTWNVNARLQEPVAKPNRLVAFNDFAQSGQRRARLTDASLSLFGAVVPEAPTPPPPPPEEEPVSKKRSLHRGTKESVRHIERLVHTLLYDELPRKRLLQRQLDEVEGERQRGWPAYAKYCSENAIIMDIIRQRIIDDLRYANTKFISTEISTDLAREHYYVQALAEIYHKIIAVLASNKIDIDAMCIAVLYLMAKDGFIMAGIQLLPADSFLSQRLPQINDLPAFKYPKKKITVGVKLIKKYYATALRSGQSRQELALATAVPTPLNEQLSGVTCRAIGQLKSLATKATAQPLRK